MFCNGLYGKESKKRVDMCICITDSLCCTVETNTMLLINCCCCVASVMSDSVRPHRWQPTRLCRPWDFPGKNTGVGCHFLLQCMKLKSESYVWLFVTPWTAAHQAPPSMGFSRQEYWNGLPLPSPVNQLYSNTFFFKWVGCQWLAACWDEKKRKKQG